MWLWHIRIITPNNVNDVEDVEGKCLRCLWFRSDVAEVGDEDHPINDDADNINDFPLNWLSIGSDRNISVCLN